MKYERRQEYCCSQEGPYPTKMPKELSSQYFLRGDWPRCCRWYRISLFHEPFGLVAVDFDRKGALGIGALLGGLGQMLGCWV
jgi:hypothetical protein